MKYPHDIPIRQRGIVMLDALIGIIIFSIGIVGMVTLQSAAVNMASSAKYRTDAAMLADQVIAQMWVANNKADGTGTLIANFQSPGGAAYKTWAASVTTLSAYGGLPGAAASPPTITVDANNNVTVTVFWRAPSDSSTHQYVSTTQIQP